jgi:large subunit ribosomal protein L25
MAATTNTEAVIATPREGKFNKNAARRVRVAGKIPAVVYGAGKESVAVSVDPKVITRILHSDSGHNSIFDLNVEGSGVVKAMIVDWQHEPIKDKLIHVDLKRIAMDKVITVEVPIGLEGVPVGVKVGGGMLDQVLREVEIECLPSDIPAAITVDVSGLNVHDVLRVSDLPHSGKFKFVTPEDTTVAHVIMIAEEVAPTADAVAAAGAVEPEVVKKGKTESEEAPAAESKDTKGGKK